MKRVASTGSVYVATAGSLRLGGPDGTWMTLWSPAVAPAGTVVAANAFGFDSVGYLTVSAVTAVVPERTVSVTLAITSRCDGFVIVIVVSTVMSPFADGDVRVHVIAEVT